MSKNEDRKHTSSLEKPSPEARQRNALFEQELADSLDHTKQSGRGKGDNKLAKPAGKSSD